MNKYKNLLEKIQKKNNKTCLNDFPILMSVESKNEVVRLEFLPSNSMISELCLGVVYND